MKRDTITVIITGAPYGNENVWNGLKLALTLSSSSIGANVNVCARAM
jgi:sulfur relay (sulfurtransferase) complex TusBCD TusD component (DsrE family)